MIQTNKNPHGFGSTPLGPKLPPWVLSPQTTFVVPIPPNPKPYGLEYLPSYKSQQRESREIHLHALVL